MNKSLDGPGGEESPRPPNMKALVPTIEKECPERGCGIFESFLFFATTTAFFQANFEGASGGGGRTSGIFYM
jgi:hypothetical protein